MQDTELFGRFTCRAAGVRFVGIQNGYGVTPDLLLFQPFVGPAEGTTLAVPANALPHDIHTKIEQHDRLFGREAA